jgi:DNA-directed RNA polymerase specialized sigma24 family protein
MTEQDFVSVLEQYSESAKHVIMWRFEGNAALADDAVQDACEYLWRTLDQRDRITQAYFIRCCVDRARNIRRATTRQYMRVLPQGVGKDLEVVEEQELEKRLGRAYDPNSRDNSKHRQYLV